MPVPQDARNLVLPVSVVLGVGVTILSGIFAFTRTSGDERVQTAVTNAQTAARLGAIEQAVQSIQADQQARAAKVDAQLDRLLSTVENRMGGYVSQAQMALWVAKAKSAGLTVPDFP